MFPEHKRYEYNLNQNSIVLDLGFYEGTFSQNIYEKYGCKIYAFEPIKAFYNQSQLKNVELYNYGVGGYSRYENITVQKDASSIFIESDLSETIFIKSIDEVLADLNLNHVNLMKINIEGCEFELLDRILSLDLQYEIENIQVQFHKFVNNAVFRRNQIRSILKKTHKLTYNFPFIWENWKLCN